MTQPRLLRRSLKLSPSESHMFKTVSQDLCPSDGRSCHIAAERPPSLRRRPALPGFLFLPHAKVGHRGVAAEVEPRPDLALAARQSLPLNNLVPAPCVHSIYALLLCNALILWRIGTILVCCYSSASKSNRVRIVPSLPEQPAGLYLRLLKYTR